MAEDYDKLKKAVDDLEVTLYDDTKGYSLASKMADAREKYGVKSTQYLSFKRQWDAYKKEYDEKKLRLDAMDAASKKEKKQPMTIPIQMVLRSRRLKSMTMQPRLLLSRTT